MTDTDMPIATAGRYAVPTSARAATLNRTASMILFYALAIVFLWFGGMKFTDYEAGAIAGLIMNSPLVGWWHAVLGIKGAALMLGVFEVLAGLLLAARAFSPRIAAVGAAMAVVTFLVTVTFLFTTPGVAEARAGGFPGLSAMPGQFLLKDIVLLAASFFCLTDALAARAVRAKP